MCRKTLLWGGYTICNMCWLSVSADGSIRSVSLLSRIMPDKPAHIKQRSLFNYLWWNQSGSFQMMERNDYPGKCPASRKSGSRSRPSPNTSTTRCPGRRWWWCALRSPTPIRRSCPRWPDACDAPRSDSPLYRPIRLEWCGFDPASQFHRDPITTKLIIITIFDSLIHSSCPSVPDLCYQHSILLFADLRVTCISFAPQMIRRKGQVSVSLPGQSPVTFDEEGFNDAQLLALCLQRSRFKSSLQTNSQILHKYSHCLDLNLI